MNYGDFTINGATGDEIELIMGHFNVDWDDLLFVESTLNIHRPKLAWSYYFLCDCIETGRSAQIEQQPAKDGVEIDISDIWDRIYVLEADAIPHQTYVQWMVWCDLTEDYGFEEGSIDIGSHVSLTGEPIEHSAHEQSEYAAAVLYAWAGQIIFYFNYPFKPGQRR